MKFYALIFISFLMLAGCMPSPYYQKSYTIPQNAWQYNFQPTFKIEVTDTNSLYDMYFIIRHTDVYSFSNIWMNIYMKQPGDTAFTKTPIEVTLAATTGQWMGRGMGEIWEQRIPLTEPGDRSILRKKGTYEIKLQQNMRINPLPEVLQVGLRVERGGARNVAKS